MTTGTEKTMSRRMMRAAPVAVVVLGLILAAAGCREAEESQARPEVARNVRVLEMQPTDLEEYFEISGPLRPQRGTDISAEETGAVFAIPRDKGETVAAGEVILEQDRRILAAEMAAAEDMLAQQVHAAETATALFEAGKASETERLAAEAARAQAESAYDVAKLRWRRAAVKAPFAGRVVDRYVELGELVTPGRAVARVVDPYVLKLAGSVSEREVAWLEVGAEARVTLEGMGRTVAGEVAWMAFEADPVTGKFKVEVCVDNSDLALRPGVVARARIHKITHEDVLVAPRDAVMYTAEGEMVYVVEGDRALKRLVELGPAQGLMVVIERGLAPGERLVVRGHRDLVEGALVDVTEQAAARDGSAGGDPEQIVEAASGGEEAGR